MYKNKRATILIYILILISIVMIMAVVVLNNSVMLENALSYQTIKSDLSNKIKEKGDMLASYNILINSDGGGFVDNISCPDNIIMSGSTIFSSGIEIERAHSGTTHFCSGTYNSIILNVFPNSDNTSFTGASWGPDTVAFNDTISSLVGDNEFPTYDSGTYITIPKDSFLKPDGIDDDFNNDNYNGDYTDSSFTLKLDGPILYEKVKDNDSDGRISINGYVPETGGLENVFWNNEISNNYIDDNSNNYDNAYTRIGDVNPGYVKLSVDKSSTIRVVKFDRARYNLNKELYVLESFEGTVTGSQSGYIQKVGSSLNLNGTVGSAYPFNFTNSDYAIFIKNNGSGMLNYKISGATSTRGIYINPINDSYPEEIRILSSHIIIDSGVYIGKQTEYIKLK